MDINAIIGRGPRVSGLAVEGMQQRGYRRDHKYVIEQIQRLLDKIPEVKKAKGNITVTLEGQKPKTLTFSYR